MTRTCRLAVLASHPVQYFTPLYRRLARHPEIALEVMFCRDFGVRPRFDKQFGQAITWDTDQLEGYPHRFLRNISPVTDTFNPLHAINPAAFTRLLRGFDAVWMNGYMYPSNWLAAVAAKLTRTSILLRSELRPSSTTAAQSWKAGVRRAVIAGWVRASDALLYIGQENLRAYREFGAREDQLFFSPYASETEAVQRARARALESMSGARAALGIPPDRTVVVFVGKLTLKKHPESVLHVAGDPWLRDRVHVIVAGSGPEETALRQAAEQRGLENVTWFGFVNQTRLPDLYAVGDVFLMPSEFETWGLVLNEAMAAGLAPIVSSGVGAAADLITEGETGMMFPSGDWEALRAAVRSLVSDPQRRRQMGEYAMRRVSGYSYEAAADGVVNALRALGHVRSPLASAAGASLLDALGTRLAE